MSGATLVWLCELFDVQHAQSNQILKKTTTTSKTHVYLEVCSWGNPRKAFEPKKNPLQLRREKENVRSIVLKSNLTVTGKPKEPG
jgi:hypothetical protein